MISRFFIDRPIFAWVISIVIMLAGAGSIAFLPVEQYPDIAPPQVNVRATYPGASAETLESSVTQIIEQQLTGIDGLLYFTSTSNSNGSVNVSVTLEKGTNPDTAQVQVQNKVQQALPRLPQAVQQQGLVVTKSNPDFLMVVSVYDESDRTTSGDVADFLVSNLQDAIGRIQGVGDVNVFGSQYAMRIWLDPYRLAGYQLMPSDVTAAIQAQNSQVAAGQIGAQPAPPGQMLNATVTARSRLTTAEQFRQILVKTQADGSRVLLGDVARVELGNENYTTVSRLNGHPGAGIAISLAPGADALRTAELVRAEMARQYRSFPPGFKYAYPNDSTAFIRLSVEEVVKTLVEAIVLVVLVMFVFLQNWRATLIPAIAVPVVLLGTFGVLAVFGFSINTLTLFGLVLSIGLLVDDAIVVVENVERVMRENPGMSARDATIQSMGEIQTALVAIALVLSAVFLPMAFFGGSVGEIYRQFSITVVSSMVLSVVVAIVLSPALAASLLKRHDERAGSTRAGDTRAGEARAGEALPAAAPNDEALPDERRGTSSGPSVLSRFSRAVHRFGERFNAGFDRTADRYRDAVAWLVPRSAAMFLAYAVITVALVVVFLRLPTGFVPAEDQGIAQLSLRLPPGATQERTLAAARQVEDWFRKNEARNVGVIYTVIGAGQGGAAQSAGRGFLAFKPWDERKGKENSAASVTRRATQSLKSLRDAEFFALNPPPIRGLGQSSGFTMELLNSGGLTREQFSDRLEKLLTAARADPALTNVRENSLADTATLNVEIDQAKVGALGIAQRDVDATLTAAWGGTYVNDFVDRGRVKRVYVQSDGRFRSRPEDLGLWYVRSANGSMAPFSSFARTSWGRAPTTLTRFNGLSAYEIQGEAAEGSSSGEAMDRIVELARELPGVAVAWSGLSYQERLSSGQAPLLYAISLLVVFLCLAALYESWSLPIAVMLVIPLGLIGATLAVLLRGLENDVYFQVGLLTTMGLAAKNAILIVEFAEQAEKQGAKALDAALQAARLRLRPILMTSLAFVFGVLPLAISTGAGAQSRIAIGTAVIGGMITATVLAVFFVPGFFVAVREMGFWRARRGVEEVPVGER